MAAIVTTLLIWIGIGIALAILALLVIPIRIDAGASVDDRNGLGYLLIADWALGLFSVRMDSGRAAGVYLAGWRVCHLPKKSETKKEVRKKSGKKIAVKRRGMPPEYPQKKDRKKSMRKKRSPKAWLTWIRNNYQRIGHVLRRFAGACFLQGYVTGKIGLPDPADTAHVGILAGLLQVQSSSFNLSLATAYDCETIHIAARVRSTLIIGYLGLVALGLLLDKRVRMMLRTRPQQTR
jgi:hypothetical protein